MSTGRNDQSQCSELDTSNQGERIVRVTDVLLEYDHMPQLMLAEGESGRGYICMLVQFLSEGPRYACRLISMGLRAELNADRFELRAVFEGAVDIRAAEVGEVAGTLELQLPIDRLEMSSLLPDTGLTFPGLSR